MPAFGYDSKEWCPSTGTAGSSRGSGNYCCLTQFGAILACLLWSTAFVGVKVALNYSTPISLGGMRFMLAGALLLPFVIFRKGFWSEARRYWKVIALVSVLQTFSLYMFFNIGMTMVPSSLGAIIIGSGPLITAVTAHILLPADKLTFGKIIAIVVGVAGVSVISLSRKPWASVAGRSVLLGIGLLLLASVSSALGNIVYARCKDKPNGFKLNAVQLFAGGLMMFVVSIPIEGLPNLEQLSLEFYLAILWLAFLSAAAFSIWFMLLQKTDTKVSNLNVWKFIIPVCGAIFGWYYFPNEAPSPATLIGMSMVGVSVIAYYRADKSASQA